MDVFKHCLKQACDAHNLIYAGHYSGSCVANTSVNGPIGASVLAEEITGRTLQHFQAFGYACQDECTGDEVQFDFRVLGISAIQLPAHLTSPLTVPWDSRTSTLRLPHPNRPRS